MQIVSSIREELLALVNQTGKLRMLSHRAVMMLLLQQIDQDDADQHRLELDKTIGMFNEFSEPIIDPASVKGDFQRCALFLDNRGLFEKSDIDAVLFFRNGMFTFLNKISTGVKVEVAEIKTFSHFVANDLLVSLNKILEAITLEIAEITRNEEAEANRKHAVISRSVEELEKAARMVYMISLNASIEASRLGNDGAGFRQIVREVRELSDQMGSSAAKLKVEILDERD